MKKIFYYFIVLFLFISISCSDELQRNELQSQESTYKADIDNYFLSLKELKPSEAKNINELVSNIDFTKVSLLDLRTTEKLIVADLKIVSGFNEPDNMKAIFFVNEEKIVRSNIVTFSNKISSTEYEKLILSVLNGEVVKTNYSGKVSLFNPYRELLLFNSFNNGSLDAVGFTRKHKSGKMDGRSNSCTDWYLVSYYANGNVTKEYVFTTCDNGCQFYRIGRTNCGGGGESGATGGGAELPANPVDGTTYEYTDKNGQYTKYIFNAAINTWKIVEVILPAAVVEAKSDEYPFLDFDWPGAYHGQIVLGTDNIIYTFGGDGNWHGEAPEYIVDGGQHGEAISNLKDYLKCFSILAGAKVTIFVDQPIANSSSSYNGGNVGHAWMSISQTINGVTVTRLVGFYPIGVVYPGPGLANNSVAAGQVKDDSGRTYDVSVDFNLSPNQLHNLIDYISIPGRWYDLDDFNCTHFIIEAFSRTNISLPRTAGTWPYGGGLNPGNFGQDLRNYAGSESGKDTNGGQAIQVSGSCQ